MKYAQPVPCISTRYNCNGHPRHNRTSHLCIDPTQTKLQRALDLRPRLARHRTGLRLVLFRRGPALRLGLLLILRLLAILHVRTLGDPLVYLLFVVHEHLTQTGFGRLDELAVALGWLAPSLHVVPDAVRVRDEDKGVLADVSMESQDLKGPVGLHLCTTATARPGCGRLWREPGSRQRRKQRCSLAYTMFLFTRQLLPPFLRKITHLG